MALEPTKRRGINAYGLLDAIKQPVSTSRTNYIQPIRKTNNNRKYIEGFCVFITIMLIIVFIYIQYHMRHERPITFVASPTMTSTPFLSDTDNDNYMRNDAIFNDLNRELIATEDIIIEYEKSHPQDPISIQTALGFTNEDCTKLSECGRCWLHKHKNIVIQISSIIQIPSNKLHSTYNKLNLLVYWIILRNINIDQPICDAKDITIYLQITDENNESVGGLAIADSTSLCGWKYKWIVSKPGEYNIKAHLLYYRGYSDYNEDLCKYQKNIRYIDKTTFQEKNILLKIPNNWRFYGQVEGCCEWCNRMNGKCKSWTSGGRGSDRCILFTESPFDDEKSVGISEKKGFISGLYRNEAQQWYLGSLLNIQPNKCHNTKLDLIYGSQETYIVKSDLFGNNNLNDDLCVSNHEIGRWIAITDDDCNSNNSNEFNSYCYIKKAHWLLSYRYKPYQCSYKQMKASDIQQCLISNNLNRIAVGGDSLIRLFVLEMVRYVFGEGMKGVNVPHWEYSKHYKRDNINMEIWFMGYDHSIDDVSFMETFIKSDDKPNVIIHNFQIIHKMWHYNTSGVIDIISEYKISANKLFEKYYGPQSDGNWPIRMVFEAPLLVSEREYHNTANRAKQYNKIMKSILEPDGWIFIPVMEISKARMYDSTNPKDGVIDGMHMSNNILIEISRIVIDMLCRFDLKQHTPSNKLNPLYMTP